MTSKDSWGKVVLTSCSYDCGARCILKVRVEDGRILDIGTDDRPMPSLKACVRGLAQRDVVYAPDRLTKPLRRIGERGSGSPEAGVHSGPGALPDSYGALCGYHPPRDYRP